MNENSSNSSLKTYAIRVITGDTLDTDYLPLLMTTIKHVVDQADTRRILRIDEFLMTIFIVELTQEELLMLKLTMKSADFVDYDCGIDLARIREAEASVLGYD